MSDFTHRSESVEHYTPPEYVEAGRELMGGIDFDPFSCSLANQVVKARAFCALPLNGYLCEWSLEGQPTKAFVNPAGGKLSRKTLEPLKGGNGFSAAAVAWAKLVHEYEHGNVEQAVFICFNLELLRTSQLFDGIRSCAEFPICYPRERLQFWGEEVPIGTGDPQHPNAVVYIPPKGWDELGSQNSQHGQDFERLFSPFGLVKL